MTVPDREIENAALDWVIRQRDDAFDAWDAFGAWLAADPAHAETYAAVATADQDITALLASAPSRATLAGPQVQTTMAPSRARMRPRAWFGGAIAAGIIAIAGVAAWQQRSNPYVVETRAGAPRAMILADGSRLQLNGGTRLTLDHNHQRDIALEHGEVVFTVVHDAARPFRVAVGDATFIDVGTVFNVVRTPGLTRVAVAEGSIVFNPGGEAVRLDAGRALSSRDGAGRVEVTEVNAAAVGSWRAGRLVYDGAKLADVAADLARSLGVDIAVDPAVSGQIFRGVIKLGKSAEATMTTVGPLLGVKVISLGNGWRLAQASS